MALKLAYTNNFGVINALQVFLMPEQDTTYAIIAVNTILYVLSTVRVLAVRPYTLSYSLSYVLRHCLMINCTVIRQSALQCMSSFPIYTERILQVLCNFMVRTWPTSATTSTQIAHRSNQQQGDPLAATEVKRP